MTHTRINKMKVFYIELRTGCSCCSYENYKEGFFPDLISAVKRVKYHTKNKTLSSRYAKKGLYDIYTVELEDLGNGMFANEDILVRNLDFGNPERIHDDFYGHRIHKNDYPNVED